MQAEPANMQQGSGSTYSTTSTQSMGASADEKLQKMLLRGVVQQLMEDVLAVRDSAPHPGGDTVAPAGRQALVPSQVPPSASDPPVSSTPVSGAFSRVLINGVPAHGLRNITIADASITVDRTAGLNITSPTFDPTGAPGLGGTASTPVGVVLNGQPMATTPVSMNGVVVVDARGVFIITRLGP
jgi:hypothetical protein